ncbi:hypothetical protein Metbo_2317 [Methanobacterium lacus]|uniref:Uncharacterized protein n=1 Tax=Methanobacterium lacus (strain AL-21) TaxID=877455 RepID=F0T624_METLA|nr:hypothetical protein [Methanobacterium lacus]ADZ10531.1 hypothetical protein Metbo_2317 [Methanobacterium lacus]
MNISPIEKRLIHVTAFLIVVFIFSELYNTHLIPLSYGIFFIIIITFLGFILQYYIKVDESKEHTKLILWESLIIILLIGMIVNPFYISDSLEDNTQNIFQNSCSDISYYELNKNFNNYEGKKVKFSGFVEHTDVEGDSKLIILDVNKEPNDKIAVFHTGDLSINANNSITVYGIITGKRELSDPGKFYPTITAFYINST